jgi:putative hydrolase of the HAD superfamily
MGYSPEAKSIILNDIFKSSEWKSIDNGDITTREAIENISTASSLNKPEITAVFNLRKKILYPIDQNIKLLPELKKRGFKLYFLSNFPEDIFDEVFEEYPFFGFFDGGIISARVKASKPGRKIFEILLNNYFLEAKECLFIDDLEANVQTANLLGMKGICALESANLLDQIEKELNAI